MEASRGKMKIRHFSIYGIWPAIGLLTGGIYGKLTNEEPQTVNVFIVIALIYIAIWFVAGLFKGGK
jgi:hypothetical protein